MELTVEKIKKMQSDKQMIGFAKSVFESMAYTQTVAKIVRPKQIELLEKYQFEMDADIKLKHPDRNFSGGPCLKPEHTYRISESDFQIYINEMYDFYIEKGFQVEKDRCPLLIAENLERQVKRQFADYSEYWTGMNTDKLLCTSNGLENYSKYLNILLQIFAPMVKK